MSWILIAAIEVPDVIVNWKKFAQSSSEGLLLFGSLGLVILLIVLWAVFVRKKRRRREDYQPGTLTEEPPKRRKWRRRRRDHRPANPTLAETGGLPPIRPPDSGR